MKPNDVDQVLQKKTRFNFTMSNVLRALKYVIYIGIAGISKIYIYRRDKELQLLKIRGDEMQPHVQLNTLKVLFNGELIVGKDLEFLKINRETELKCSKKIKMISQ